MKKMKRGFTEIALVVLIAIAGVSYSMYRRSARRFDVPRQYRPQVHRAIQFIEERSGLEWPEDRRLRVHPLRGQKQFHGGWWMVWVESEGVYKAGFAYEHGHCVVVTDPEGRMPNLVLKHELAHQLYWAHNIPGEKHHRMMARDGIPDMLPYGGPPGGY